MVSSHMSQQPATGTEGQEGQTWVQVAEGETQEPAGVGPDEAERQEPQEDDVSYELVAKPGCRQRGRKEGSSSLGQQAVADHVQKVRDNCHQRVEEKENRPGQV